MDRSHCASVSQPVCGAGISSLEFLRVSDSSGFGKKRY